MWPDFAKNPTSGAVKASKVAIKYTIIARAHTNKRPDEFGISVTVTLSALEDSGLDLIQEMVDQAVRACDRYAAENGALGWQGDLYECDVYSDGELGPESHVRSFRRYMEWKDHNRGVPS